MKNILKKYKIILLAAVLYTVFFFVKRDIFSLAVSNSLSFLIEMLQVLPPVMVISALITVWVPNNLIERSMGSSAGLKGKLFSILIGSLSAGPIYAAFPATLVLFKKGASVSNLVVILSSWAVIKIPMIFVETSFLGVRFALTRVALTVPAILVMGYLVEKIVKRNEIKEIEESSTDSLKEIIIQLPNLNCGACGYSNCSMFAEAIAAGKREIGQCVILKAQKG